MQKMKKKAFTPLEIKEYSGKRIKDEEIANEVAMGSNRQKFLTGFTLIELMVVIAIIGVLLAVIAPQVFRQINKGKTAACEQFYAAVKTAATNYYLDNVSWPSTFYDDSGNNDLMVTTGASTWDGPYLDRWPATNPWGGHYWFRNFEDSTKFGAIAAGERWLVFGLVPYADAVRIDTHIDGTANGISGWVRHAIAVGGIGAVSILVSRDGPVS